MDTNARGFWLVQRTFGWRNLMPENFLEINRYFDLTSYCSTIGQSNNAFSRHTRFSLAGKRRIHVLLFLSISWSKKWRTLTETIFQGHTKIALYEKLKQTSWKLVVFTNEVRKNSRYSVSVFDKKIIPLALVGYEIIIANEARSATPPTISNPQGG